ncbi:MAG: glutamine-hydrolyzing GMP synthase [Conexivisphaerales archaeon]
MALKGGIAVLNFGGQYAHLIRRRLREAGVECELLPYNSAIDELNGARGVILSGGPSSVYGEDSLQPSFRVKDLKVPVLGICYGHQLLAYQLGGKVEPSRFREYGKARIKVLRQSKLFRGTRKEFDVWLSHSDAVTELPAGAYTLCRSEYGDNAAICYKEDMIYSLQFHPEVSHTQFGDRILENFARLICGCKPGRASRNTIAAMVSQVRKQVGKDKAICAVSGGLDSTTAAVLVKKAIGRRLKCVFVNHGLMRKGEAEEVLSILRNNLGLDVDYVDASERFLLSLKGITDPERKRLVVGKLFGQIFEEYVSNRLDEGYRWLVQGTIYPDVIESSMPVPGSPRIKSHHNVAGLPDSLKKRLKVLEPLKELYKDEVRELARKIGIPGTIIARHPFPGPGLSVRIIGEVTPEKLEVCREASWIFEDELKRAGLYDKLWQAFAFVGDDRAVGVVGDNRRYGYIVTLRAVTSRDGMTASFYPIPWRTLDKISRRITNSMSQVTMVSYSVSNKPPSTIEPQ